MRNLFTATMFLAFVCHGTRAEDISYSQKEYVSDSVGLLRTEISRFYYRGSGTIIRDPRLIYSCAHNLYERGQWASDYRFYPGVHQMFRPAAARGLEPRGFHYFTRYVRAARFTNGESRKSFAADFVVLYGNTAFGPAMEIQEESVKLLQSDRPKRIVGYPSDIDFNGRRGFYYQHSTDWFPNRAFRLQGPYQEFSGVSTGPGNSGGGVFLRDEASGKELFAGVLVSGSLRTAGVVSMNRASRRLADQALGSAARGFRISNRNQIALDGSRNSITRTLPVRDEGGEVASLSLAVELAGPGSASALVWIESPEGRIQRVAATGSPNLAGPFVGAAAAGEWKLHVRSKTGLPTRFLGATLAGSADGEP